MSKSDEIKNKINALVLYKLSSTEAIILEQLLEELRDEAYDTGNSNCELINDAL